MKYFRIKKMFKKEDTSKNKPKATKGGTYLWKVKKRNNQFRDRIKEFRKGFDELKFY